MPVPGSTAVCVELSELALPYLEENVRRFGSGRVFVHKADVLEAPGMSFYRERLKLSNGSLAEHKRPEAPDAIFTRFDIICSNPPYIRTEDIAGLSREVQQEPRMALDGGEDGCVFYRAIAERWSGLLRSGGMLAFEIGVGMENAVAQILEENGYVRIGTKTDMQNIIRTVYGTKC